MRFAKEGKEENKSAIIYNDDITLWNIPLEAYESKLSTATKIEWIMERYQVTTHKESGIVNDPNLWCDEQHNLALHPRLIKRIVTPEASRNHEDRQSTAETGGCEPQ